MSTKASMSEAKPEKAGESTATRLEDAAKQNNTAAFRNVMDEVTDYRNSHSKEASEKYMSSLDQKLKNDDMIPELSIFNAKAELGTLDVNQDGNLDRAELTANSIAHPLEKRLLDEANKTLTQDQVSFSRGDLDKQQKDAETLREDRSNLRALFAPGANGNLYSQLADGNGAVSIDVIRSFQTIHKENPNILNLSKEQVKALEWLEPQTHGPWRINVDQNELKQIAQSKGLKIDDRMQTITDQPQTTSAVPKVDGSTPTDTRPAAISPRSNDTQVAVDKPADSSHPAAVPTKPNDTHGAIRKPADASHPAAVPTKPNDTHGAVRKPADSSHPAAVPTKPNDTHGAVRKPADASQPAAVPAKPNEAQGVSRKPVDTHGSVLPPETDRTEPEKSNRQKELDKLMQKDPVKERELNAMKAQEMKKNIDDALTVRKSQSYAHSAERILALAGNTDPTGKQIRTLAHQLWVADGRRKAGTLVTNQKLTLDDQIRKNPDLRKLFAH